MTKIPTEKMYLQMTAHKTGVLARLSVNLTATAINIPKDETVKLATFAEKIGVAFQI